MRTTRDQVTVGQREVRWLSENQPALKIVEFLTVEDVPRRVLRLHPKTLILCIILSTSNNNNVH